MPDTQDHAPGTDDFPSTLTSVQDAKIVKRADDKCAALIRRLCVYSDTFGVAMRTIALTGMFIEKGRSSFEEGLGSLS